MKKNLMVVGIALTLILAGGSVFLWQRSQADVRAVNKTPPIGNQIGRFTDILNKLTVQIDNKLGATVATTTKPEQTQEEITEEPPTAQEDQQQPEIAQLPQTNTPVIPPQPQPQEILLETTPAIEEIAKTEKTSKGQEEEIVIESKPDRLACAIQTNTLPKLQSLVLNEIAWMGTTNSATDEWIELKNIAHQEIALANWQLQDEDGQIHFIFPDIKIQSQAFYLLERTDDSTLPDITADAVYKGSLGNTNEALYLFDAECLLQDSVEASPNWPAGDAEKKTPMERTLDLQWRTAPSSSPRAENTQSFGPGVFFSSSVSAGGGGGSTSNPVVYPKILITELQASPIGERFIELYNPNETSVDLTDWYVQRRTEGGSLGSFVSSPNLVGKSISAKSHFFIARSTSSFSSQADILLDLTITEHNTFIIKNPAGEIADKVGVGQNAPEFEGSPAQFPPENQGLAREWNLSTQSYADTENDAEDFLVASPTPKAQNAQSPSESPPEEPGPEPEPTPSQLVVFNEIAWMGTGVSANDEWIELLSTVTSTTTDMTGWRIVAEDGTPNIALSDTVSPQGYYLLERTADTTVSDISANKIYTGALSNQGELLRLFDAQNNLIDVVDASGGWFAGDNTTKQSMERINISASGSTATNWANNNLMSVNGKAADDTTQINGTPGQQNSVSN